MNKNRPFDLIQNIRIVVALILFIMVIAGSNWLLLVLPLALLIQVWKKSDCIYCEAGFCKKEK